MLAESIVCLALNIYFEARNQPIEGQIAVSQVVLNRVKSNKYPDTICAVVKQSRTHASGHPVKNKCQFSWYCDGLSDKPKDKDAYRWAITLSDYILITENIDSYVGKSTHYHANTVRPVWALSKQTLAIIGDHIFYD